MAEHLEVARAKGYKTTIAEVTGPISQHIFEKSGFKELHLVLYKDYKFGTEMPFAGIKSTDSCRLVEKTI